MTETNETPDREALLKMHAMEMYLDSVFDANPGIDRPVKTSRAWGVAAHLVVQGKAAEYGAWAELVGLKQAEGADAEEQGILEAAKKFENES